MAALTTAGIVDEHHEGDEDFSIVPQLNGVERLEDQEEAADFLRQADKIKRQIEKVEKERNLGAQCKKNGWSDWFGELEDIEKVLKEHRDAEKMTLEKELLNVHHGVRRFQRQLTDVKPAPELIEKLEEIMADVETAISTFKENERLRFEELLKEEKAGSQEISAYDRKIDTWPLAARSELRAAPATVSRGYRATDRDMPSEVRALESFLHKTGGLHGGWDQYDHQAFLKVWTRHAGRPALRKEAVLYLPGKSLQEVEQHEDWYRELLELQDQKREAIQRWRASRLREQHARIQGQDEVEEAERMEEAKNQAQQHREERLQAARRLEEWKLEKRSREELEEKERLAEEVHQRRRAKEERRRQLEVKLVVEEQLRLKREEEEEQERSRREELQREAEERRREATIGIKHFWGRDLHKVETKLQEKQQKEQQQVERQKRISSRMKEKVEGHMGRDPSRLTRPTKGWEERMKSVENSGGGGEGGREGGYLMQISHRAIPAWRQGL
ncbi:coiled-coil domain-containing protein 112 [Gadus chalcogrammus]|uniref:coiled-coil domain-containing protein 112 n=1 Tax=Gadus chalcogrammus TaxID=1042646 RepID=UPI0024C2288B|nr:coiled-coil domain-containing protein 112 [Gadus chalcogrammus]